MHVLVSGANRGLGLGLVKELLKRDDVKNVYATHRHWADIKALKSINDPRLHILEMELLEHITIGSVYVKAFEIRDTVCHDGLNLIINNAGMFCAYDVNDPKVDRKKIVETIEVNAVGPTIMCQGFLPQLRKAHKSGGKAMIINISDELGSLTNCNGSTDKKAIVYEMSKAAMNMMTRSMAADAKADGVAIVAMSPGKVQTAMNIHHSEISVEESARDMVKSIMDNVTLEHAGGFYDRHLKPIPF